MASSEATRAHDEAISVAETNVGAPEMVFIRPGAAPEGVADGAIGSPVHAVSAVASSPKWAAFGDVAIVLRTRPEPLLGVVGCFDDAERARLGMLRTQLEFGLPRLRYVTYEDAEAGVATLAEALLARFGRAAIDRATFAAVPRGGHIVLGMLAYALGLRQEQLERVGEGDILVLVDDCALTGNRLRRWLDANPDTAQVVFAPLFAAPELRTAIERDDRVLACVSAHDLVDGAPQRLGDAYSAWRDRWLTRHGDTRYWVGQPEPLCFAWSEPDVGFWNEATGREERGWPLVGAEGCLRQRTETAARVPVQEQRHGLGPLRPTDTLLSCMWGERLVMATPSWERCVVLDGTAVAIWRAIEAYGTVEGAAAEVAQAYGAPTRRVEDDVRSFVDTMLERGALQR